MSLPCKFLNEICRFLYRGEYRKFTAPCDIGKIQKDYLFKLLKQNADTVYGKKYDFGNITSYEEFVKIVPLTVYEDYEEYLDRIAEGEKQVLTKEDVLLFELTSGSSGGKKLIPYTQSLKAEFQKGIRPWLYNLYSCGLGIADGKSYWSITPVTDKKSYTKSGIPMGFEEDAEYFGFVEQAIMRKIFAVDSKVKFADDMQDFYRRTTLQLLECRELTLISVWNPTFLTILCDFIRDHMEELLQDQIGSFSEKRKSEIRSAVAKNRFDQVFPMLKIISCWADGSAKDYISDLKERFPTVHIKPKGLLATECFVSFPLMGEEDSRLSIYSHFFEFKNVEDGKIVTADQLEAGKEYEVIVTTGGGFYRYCLRDIIVVTEIYKEHPPRIKFIRRGGVTSDLFGEKLTEEFVRSVCEKLGISGDFCLLAPKEKHYCLYTTAENITDTMLDEALRDSYHYNYCRQLGQLDTAKIVAVTGNPKEAYIKRLAADGMRIGDIKPAYLSSKSGWENWFDTREEIKGC